MTTEIKETSDLGREMTCRVPKDAVDRARADIVRSFREHAKVDGFRPGKVPEAIVEQRYAREIRDELLQQLVREAYREAVREHGIRPVADPDVSDVKLGDEGLACTISFEVKPSVTLEKYSGLLLKKLAPREVTAENVAAVLADWEKRPEFAASILDPAKRRAWEQRIREQLEQMARSEAQLMEDNQLWEQLLGQAKFPAPAKLVFERTHRYVEDELRRLDLSGRSQEEVRKVSAQLHERLKPIAERDVRKYFVLDKVAELEGIAASDEETEERVVRLARLAGEPLDDVRKKLEANGRVDDIREDIRIDKAFAFIKEHAQVIERVVVPAAETPGTPGGAKVELPPGTGPGGGQE